MVMIQLCNQSQNGLLGVNTYEKKTMTEILLTKKYKNSQKRGIASKESQNIGGIASEKFSKLSEVLHGRNPRNYRRHWNGGILETTGGIALEDP